MTSNGEHLGDEIELYALGMLEDAERVRVDEHARGCGICSSRLGRAEAAVAQLIDATTVPLAVPSAVRSRVPATESRSAPIVLRAAWRSTTALTAAAAVACALVAATFAQQNAQLRTDIADDGAAFHAMIDSHFSHAQFASLEGAPLPVKVIYERHGGWYEVVGHGLDPQSRIAVVRGAIATIDPTPFSARDDVLTLALPALGPIDELRLLDSRGRTIGRVRPTLVAPGK